MLTYIKSSFFIRELFSYIIEERTLKIVKYNKFFQNKLDIGTINYQLCGQSYIVYESNIQGNIYDSNNNLIYSGGICHGIKNGYGYEYKSSFGKLSFEGGYLNRKKKMEKEKNIMKMVI